MKISTYIWTYSARSSSWLSSGIESTKLLSMYSSESRNDEGHAKADASIRMKTKKDFFMFCKIKERNVSELIFQGLRNFNIN